jgi:hypothetical protein
MIMGKPRLRQPADVARARRRSLVDLTAAASRAVDEGLLEMAPNPVAESGDDGPRVEQAANAPAQTAVPATVNGSVARPQSAEAASGSAQIQNSNGTTDIAVATAKDMQARALEAMKVGVHAALDYTKDLASPDLLEGAAAECHVVVLELMKVNAGATMAYTRELSRARTLSQLVELSSSHARRQCELVLQQAELLKSLTRNVTSSGAE